LDSNFKRGFEQTTVTGTWLSAKYPATKMDMPAQKKCASWDDMQTECVSHVIPVGGKNMSYQSCGNDVMRRVSNRQRPAVVVDTENPTAGDRLIMGDTFEY
jgi:hypothetical protein